MFVVVNMLLKLFLGGFGFYNCYYSEDVGVKCLGFDLFIRCVFNCELGFYDDKNICKCCFL